MEFSELKNKLDSKLKAIAYKLDYRHSTFNQDDLYQESLLYLWRLCDKGRLEDKNDGYILRGCFLHLKNYIRKTYKTIDKHSISIYEDKFKDKRSCLEETLSTDLGAGYLEPGESFLVTDYLKEILSPREKKVFFLKARGFTTREIAGRIGVSHVMVVKINKKARSKCLSLFEKKS